MRKLVVLSCALAALASGALACGFGGTPTPTPAPTLPPLPTPLPEIQALQTICLEVEQSYPDIEEDFSLPIAETAEGVLRGLGLQVVAEGAPCDATLAISLTGTPLGQDYVSQAPSGSSHCYTGADVAGQMAVAMADRELLTLPLHQTEWPESGTILSCPSKAKAPFYSVWPQAVLDGLTKLWGIQAAIQALVSENNSVRRAAVQTLGNMGPDAVPVLTQALEDDDWMVRVQAAWVLQWMEVYTVDTVPTLIEALENEDEEVRAAAAYTLGHTGPAEGVAPALIEALGDDDADVRGAAASSLGEIEPQEGVAPALIEALSDEDRQVRANAASSLREIGPEEGVVPALIEALSDESSYVRIVVAGTLKEITGQDFGQDAASWLEWWEEQQ